MARRFPRLSLGPPTRLTGIPRRPAALVLLLGGGLLAWGLLAAQRVNGWVFSTVSIFDLELYRVVVDRVHGGEGYYEVLADEFRRREYLIGSTFNWRLPTYAWLLGALPDASAGRLILLAVAFTSVVTTAHVVLGREVGPVGTVVGTLLLFGGAFGWAIYEPEAHLSTEPWCEALLLLSLSAYAAGRWPLGVAAALAALCLRELVLPYCVVAVWLAWWSGRRPEGKTWLVALLVAGILYALHAAAVARHLAGLVPTPADWLEPTGLRFLLRSAVMNVWVRGLPPEAAAAVLAAGVIGLLGWRGETGARLRLCAAGYLLPLTVVRGYDYWGFIYTPFVMLGVVRFPAALRDLIAAGRRQISP